jgi:hypothetical protein
MNLYLERTLSNHRHGRFLISQLDAQPIDDLPGDGLVLLHGKTYQGLDASQQNCWWMWASRPGCAVLLLPPYDAGPVCDAVDWNLVLSDDAVNSNDGVIPKSVAGEVNQKITGADGEFDRSQGHQWLDYTVNTRFIKQHSGCGVFAATCLPLWSISLLDHAGESLEWLAALMILAGQPNDLDAVAVREQSISLQPTDYTLMVCMHAWGVHSAEAISAALNKTVIKRITIAEQDIVEGIERLIGAGLVDGEGLTAAGLEALMQSPYWGYTERLKEEFEL